MAATAGFSMTDKGVRVVSTGDSIMQVLLKATLMMVDSEGKPCAVQSSLVCVRLSDAEPLRRTLASISSQTMASRLHSAALGEHHPQNVIVIVLLNCTQTRLLW